MCSVVAIVCSIASDDLVYGWRLGLPALDLVCTAHAQTLSSRCRRREERLPPLLQITSLGRDVIRTGGLKPGLLSLFIAYARLHPAPIQPERMVPLLDRMPSAAFFAPDLNSPLRALTALSGSFPASPWSIPLQPFPLALQPGPSRRNV